MRLWLCALALLCAAHPAAAQLRRPSCEVLIAYVYGGRAGLIDQSFGKSFETMTLDEFDQALDIAADCMDEVEARAPDIPGLSPRERKLTQIQLLARLNEDIRYYRNLRRERDQRSVKR
jgi:hypothetical protein